MADKEELRGARKQKRNTKEEIMKKERIAITRGGSGVVGKGLGG